MDIPDFWVYKATSRGSLSLGMSLYSFILVFFRKTLIFLSIHRFRGFLCPFHALPADEAVDVPREECRKADHGADVTTVGHCRQCPQDHQHHIVTGIGDRIVRTAAGCQINSDKAGAYGERRREQIRCTKCTQDEVEHDRHNNSQCCEQEPLAFRQLRVDRHLGAVTAVGIAQPCDQRPDRHRQRHADIGQQLAVVGEAVGDVAVDRGEDDHQHHADGVSLSGKKQRGHTDQRREQVEQIAAEHDVRQNDQADRYRPDDFFGVTEIIELIIKSFHSTINGCGQRPPLTPHS